MSRGSNPVKVELWSERFARCKDSGMTTEQFCASEEVSQACYYSWRRKLGLSTPRPSKSSRSKSFQQVIVTSAHAALSARLRIPFAPLSVATGHLSDRFHRRCRQRTRG